MVIFSGQGSTELAQATTAEIGVPLSPALLGKFSNDEVRVQLQENVRGRDVFIFQSFGDQVSDRLMEMWLMIDAAKRASAGRITAVIPWYPYCKQEKKFRGREPISARLVADLTVAAGAQRILTMDLHEGAIQGFFDIPVDHLPNLPVFLPTLREEGLAGPNTVIVAPDAGAVERASDIAGMLGSGIAVIFKHHPPDNIEDAETVETVGDLEGKRALLVDDFIFGGSTIVNAAHEVKMAGATEVNACVTHAILCGQAMERITQSDITRLYVTDTIPPRPDAPDKIKIVTIAPLLAQAIQCIHQNESVSSLLTDRLEGR
ncbi:MAG: ribose-phosphate diphosphokinase [Armatimonadetes bacterium]|nr:ribose-phosphate diphosphokinase [Armatimonadota bacterium]